jgi:hypothetical protein
MKAKVGTSPEFERFNALVGRVLSVPKAILDQRLEAYEGQTKNPKRRGPKSKKTTPKEV